MTDERSAAVRRYLHLTKEVMPVMACRGDADWPVVNDHCFQRIVLDAVSGGVWYEHIQKPAYKHLTVEQATEAVDLCEAIIAGTVDLRRLNRQSLAWRRRSSSD